MCSWITSSNLIKFQRLGFSSAISDHLFSSFRASASSWRVLLVVLLKRGYLRTCAKVISQFVLGCSSSVPPCPLAHSRKIVALCFSDSGRACPVYLCVDVHERSITRHTWLAEVLRVFSVSLSGQDTRQVAAPMASVARPRLAACAKNFAEGAPLFHVRQHCSVATGLPPTLANPAPPCLPHPRLPALPSLVPHLPWQEANPTGGSSLSPRQREVHLLHWPLSSESGERSLCSVSCVASWIIVVCSCDGTCSLSHKREPESAFSHLEDVRRVVTNCASGRLSI